MGTTRYKGENDSDILGISSLKSRDMIQTRHGVNIVDEDSDKGLPFETLQARPVAVCASAAATATKTATLQDSFADFTLINGREIIVYMLNSNTASEPTLLVSGTEAIPLECNSWNAGTFLRCKYVDITYNGTRIRKWLVDTGYTNTLSQLNGALADYGEVKLSEITTNKTWIDGKTIYRKAFWGIGTSLGLTFDGSKVSGTIATNADIHHVVNLNWHLYFDSSLKYYRPEYVNENVHADIRVTENNLNVTLYTPYDYSTVYYYFEIEYTKK